MTHMHGGQNLPPPNLNIALKGCYILFLLGVIFVIGNIFSGVM